MKTGSIVFGFGEKVFGFLDLGKNFLGFHTPHHSNHRQLAMQPSCDDETYLKLIAVIRSVGLPSQISSPSETCDAVGERDIFPKTWKPQGMSMMQAVDQQTKRKGAPTTSARLETIEAQPETPDQPKKLERLPSRPDDNITSSVIARRCLAEKGYWEYI